MYKYEYETIFKCNKNRANRFNRLENCILNGIQPEKLIPIAMALGIPDHEFNSFIHWKKEYDTHNYWIKMKTYRKAINRRKNKLKRG